MDYEEYNRALESYRSVACYTIDALETVIDTLKGSIYQSTNDLIIEILKERLETVELNLDIIREDNY